LSIERRSGEIWQVYIDAAITAVFKSNYRLFSVWVTRAVAIRRASA